MASKNIPIAEATREQLYTFARSIGLQIKGQPSAATLLELLRQDDPDREYITIPEVEDEPARVEHKQAAKSGEKRFRIRIASNAYEPGGRDPVPLGINGHVIRIMRDQEVAITEPYLKLLESVKKHEPIKDQNDRIVEWAEVPRFSFTVLGPA